MKWHGWFLILSCFYTFTMEDDIVDPDFSFREIASQFTKESTPTTLDRSRIISIEQMIASKTTEPTMRTKASQTLNQLIEAYYQDIIKNPTKFTPDDNNFIYLKWAHILSDSPKPSDAKKALILYNQIILDPHVSKEYKAQATLGSAETQLLHPLMIIDDLQEIIDDTTLPSAIKDQAEYYQALNDLPLSHFNQTRAKKRLQKLAKVKTPINNEDQDILKIIQDWEKTNAISALLVPLKHYEMLTRDPMLDMNTKAEALMESARLAYYENNILLALDFLRIIIEHKDMPQEIQEKALKLKSKIEQEYPLKSYIFRYPKKSAVVPIMDNPLKDFYRYQVPWLHKVSQ